MFNIDKIGNIQQFLCQKIENIQQFLCLIFIHCKKKTIKNRWKKKKIFIRWEIFNNYYANVHYIGNRHQ